VSTPCKHTYIQAPTHSCWRAFRSWNTVEGSVVIWLLWRYLCMHSHRLVWTDKKLAMTPTWQPTQMLPLTLLEVTWGSGTLLKAELWSYYCRGACACKATVTVTTRHTWVALCTVTVTTRHTWVALCTVTVTTRHTWVALCAVTVTTRHTWVALCTVTVTTKHTLVALCTSRYHSQLSKWCQALEHASR
jgi:hypothetical protein